jgi:hypothetical protein
MKIICVSRKKNNRNIFFKYLIPMTEKDLINKSIIMSLMLFEDNIRVIPKIVFIKAIGLILLEHKKSLFFLYKLVQKGSLRCRITNS